MNPVDALIVIAALLAVTLGAGGYVRWRENRPQPFIADEVIDPVRLGADALGRSATLLQFSTASCTRSPAVHRMLAGVADRHRGVLHLDVDLTRRPDIARHFHVLQTPTTLVLDADGVVRTRFGGAPGREVVALEVERLTTETARV